MNLIEELTQKELIRPPSWLPNSVQYLCIMGSTAYGVSNDNSDTDVYGFCVPQKTLVFPHLAGEIPGFGHQVKRFNQFQQHHVLDGQREFDITCYNIVQYFQLLMENNPNMVDSLFVPRECVIWSTQIGELVREYRKMFLHKGSWYKFRGYAFGQLSKAENAAKSDEMVAIYNFESSYNIPHSTRFDEIYTENSRLVLTRDEFYEYELLWRNGLAKTKRFENQKVFGADTKFLSHLVRLCDECAQILTMGDLDLRRAKNQVKAVRNGEWSLPQVKSWFAEQEITLEKLYRESTLPERPNEEAIKSLLLKCLEQYFGSLDKCVVEVGKNERILQQIKELVSTC